MKRTALLVLCILLTAGALAAQDPPKEDWTLEKIIERMEKNAEGVKDLTWKVTTIGTEDAAMPFNMTMKATYLRGTGLRIDAEMTQFMDLPGAGAGDQAVKLNYLYTDKELFFSLGARGSRAGGGAPDMSMMFMPGLGGMTLVQTRVPYTHPDYASFDPFFLPMGFPFRLLFDEVTGYYTVAPKMMFGQESSLKLDGSRKAGERDCFVLTSNVDGTPLKGELAMSLMGVSKSRKEFLIDKETFRIRSIDYSFTMEMSVPGMGTAQKQEVALVVAVQEEKKITETLHMPTAVEWSAFSIKGGKRVKESGVLNRTIKGYALNGGVAADSLALGGKNDVLCDAILRKPEHYEELVKAKPDDAGAWMNLAMSRAFSDPFENMFGGGDTDPDRVIEPMEKVVELRPDATAAFSALMSLYAAHGRPEKLNALIERVEKDEKAGAQVLCTVGRHLNGLKEYARAAKALERGIKGGLTPSERSGAGRELIYAAVATGDARAAVQCFAETAAALPSSRDRVAFLGNLEARLMELEATPPQEKMAEIDALAAKQKGGPIMTLARVRLALYSGNAGKAVELLTELQTDDAEIRKFALGSVERILDLRTQNVDALAGILEKLGGDEPRARFLLGRAMLLSGQKDKAAGAFLALLESPGPDSAGMVLKISQLGNLPPGTDWTEKC
ncbi:MAG: tetratricopeptide repeat protein, partial [Planctomycetota bacterium]